MARSRGLFGRLLAAPAKAALLVVVVLVLLALFTGKAVMEIGKLVTAARQTGNPQVDAFAWKIARAVLIEWGPTGKGPSGEPLEAIAALASELVDRESKARPSNFLGDLEFDAGPSVGPMQVYRKTAKELGLYKPSAAVAGDEAAEKAEYAKLAEDTSWGIRAGVAVMRSKQRILEAYVSSHPGTIRTLQDLARLYNGGGPKARAYGQTVADETEHDLGAGWQTRSDYPEATDPEPS
jgi:hypothetical protein